MLIFPINELMDEQACYDFLLHVLHPAGLCCPQGHQLASEQAPHDRHRAPIVDYRCRQCAAVCNIFTGTIWAKSRYRCSTIVLIMRGIAQGTPTSHLAQELGLDRSHLLELRHHIQQLIAARLSPSALADAVVEADEMYQHAGAKGHKHADPDDPPRRRANKVRGHGTWDNDRPPVAGVVGRASRQLRLQVLKHSNRAARQGFVEATTRTGATVNTDEWQAYNQLPSTGRSHAAVCHRPGQREWARDDDGDGVREVHCNTMEGIWTGLRNFLRPFRGVSKYYLDQYCAVYEWIYRFKELSAEFLRSIMTCYTSEPT